MCIRDRSITLHDSSLKTKLSLDGHDAEITDLKFFPSSQVLLSSSLDMRLKIWSALDGSNPRTIMGHKSIITGTEIIERGRNILSCSKDGTVKSVSYTHLDVYKRQAIAWSPHKRGILATGGGTADKKMKIWNVNTSTKLRDIDTGSQVCNMIWSKNTNELVTSHGYSRYNLCLLYTSRCV